MECFVCLFACLFLRDLPVAPHLLEFENTQTSIPQLYNKIPDRLKHVVRMGLFAREEKAPFDIQKKKKQSDGGCAFTFRWQTAQLDLR